MVYTMGSYFPLLDYDEERAPSISPVLYFVYYSAFISEISETLSP